MSRGRTRAAPGNKVLLILDETTNQNYAQWTSNGLTTKVWLEDDESIRSKLEVMKTQNVNGVAVWQLAYSSGDVWEVINEYYNP